MMEGWCAHRLEGAVDTVRWWSRTAARLILNTTVCQVDPGPSGIIGCGRERIIQREGKGADKI